MGSSRMTSGTSLQASGCSQRQPLGRPRPQLADERCCRRRKLPTARYRGPPMTLANMRAQGVRSLWVVCELCRHEAVLNVDGYGDAVPVPAFGPRMICYVM